MGPRVADVAAGGASPGIDPTERVDLLLRDLRSARDGLSSREAERRLVQFGPNELRAARRAALAAGARAPVHASARAAAVGGRRRWRGRPGSSPVAVAIVVVIVINAAFAFVQEMQAERAVEALARYLPAHAKVLRDGAASRSIDAARARARRRAA